MFLAGLNGILSSFTCGNHIDFTVVNMVTSEVKAGCGKNSPFLHEAVWISEIIDQFAPNCDHLKHRLHVLLYLVRCLGLTKRKEQAWSRMKVNLIVKERKKTAKRNNVHKPEQRLQVNQATSIYMYMYLHWVYFVSRSKYQRSTPPSISQKCQTL